MIPALHTTQHAPQATPGPRQTRPAFDLPPNREAAAPPEARGVARDDVRLMVSTSRGQQIAHTRFRRLGEFLHPGDLLVVNTSGTLKAALAADRPGEGAIKVHISTIIRPHGPALAVVELRRVNGRSTEPLLDAMPGETIALNGGGSLRLCGPRTPAPDRSETHQLGRPNRLWTAELTLPEPLPDYLDHHGAPIRYRYVPEPWPIETYQTVFATQPGSAEMPSAGRAFSTDLVTHLVARGIRFAPIVLHTGVASLETHEPPYPEPYRVPSASAAAINQTRRAGGRVIAVGTTAVRAVETMAGRNGTVRAGAGWTDLIITPTRGVYAIDGLLTGFHAPEASHLDMLVAVAGYNHVRDAYRAALAGEYLWHEFGDLHLLFS